MAWLAEREEPRYSFDPHSISANFVPFHREAGSDDIEARIIAPIQDKAEGLKQVFIRDVYTKGIESVKRADTVVAIGYSFNPHDRGSYEPLLHALGESGGRRLLVVSPDSRAVAGTLRPAFAKLTIECQEMGFRQWVQQSFPGLPDAPASI